LLGQINDADLGEISGITVSRRHAGIYWLHNDSLNPETLYAIDETGALRARVGVAGAPNVDWEDLASFEDGGQSYLALGDIGNNFGLDADLHIYVLPEPALTDTAVRPLRDYRFRFADGPRDAESLAVDLVNHRFLIADKGRRPAGLYALPMEGDVRRATRIADIPQLSPQRRSLVAPLSVTADSMLTAMDLSPDGRRLLLLTYSHLLLFERGADEDWAPVLARAPRGIILPSRLGFEAACWSRDGHRALITHERRRSPGLYAWTIP